jgi:hypothetical protein
LNTYMSGSLVTTTAQFVNALGVNADPSTITLKYRAGAGSVIVELYGSSAVVRNGTGNYSFNIDTTGWAGPGLLLYTTEWIGTGNVQAINPGYWQVEPPAI